MRGEVFDNMQPTATPMGAKHIHNEIDRYISQQNSGRRWAIHPVGGFYPVNTDDVLAAGFYEPIQSPDGVLLVPRSIANDTWINLEEDATTKVIEAIETFWKAENLYKEYGFLWKRGVLLHGPAGSGKTTAALRIGSFAIERGGIAIMGAVPILLLAGIKLARDVEPDRPIVLILEDVDTMAIMDPVQEASLLQLLDGARQYKNVISVATTNYPEKLDRRFTDRPSRFDTIVYVGTPTMNDRIAYMRTKLPNESEDNIRQWAEKMNGLMLSHIKEFVIATKIIGNDVDETIKRLKGQHSLAKLKSTDTLPLVGQYS